MSLPSVIPLEQLQGLLGYANFSTGKPDARFRQQLNEAYSLCAATGTVSPWRDLHAALENGLKALHQSGAAAFRETAQAEAVVAIVFDHMLPAYRAHHALLLAHCSDLELFQPFFLAVVFEAVLGQRGPWQETDRIVRDSLKQLNDYVGHRPVAVLETRQRGEPYDHERVRPVPLYFQGAGVGHGPYREIISKTLEVLQATDPAILADACFDPNLLDELGLDPRGYDFDHPADKRSNYCFGEWDPHHIDGRGNYRRFVVRQLVLDGLWGRVQDHAGPARDEYLFEAAAVLACAILMAAGVSGAGPTTYDSSVNLGTLVPRIATYRDAFYTTLLERMGTAHGNRLRTEIQVTRQPFGAARQALNRCLAQQRAWQLQRRHLALLFADVGYPAASRRQLQDIAPASVRLLAEMHILLTAGSLAIDRGDLAPAAANVALLEDLLKKGIACGALADPWNILGFQGQFPRSVALEDSIRDQRNDALIRVVERLFNLLARLMSENAVLGPALSAPGDPAGATAPLRKDDVATAMQRLANWWDHYATTTVSDIHHVHGGQAAESARQVARALARWRERGAASADLAFWREHLDSFHSPEAFALVIDTLLHKQDYRASMSLLMTWLGQSSELPLEEGDFSFFQLALRWMLGVCSLANTPAASVAETSPIALAVKFFDYLEANAEDFGQVPRLDLLGAGETEASEPDEAAADEETPDDEESLFGAAYDDMTYKDSTDDDVDAEVLDFMPTKAFDLTLEAERLEKRLKFLSTQARLWNIATRALREGGVADRQRCQEAVAGWLAKARRNYQGLLTLLDAIHDHEIPQASGSYDSLVEADKRRLIKERLLSIVISSCLDQALAVGALRGIRGQEDEAASPISPENSGKDAPNWEQLVLRLERSLLQKEPAQARMRLPEFIQLFKAEPLLYTPLAHGGHPRQILRATIAQTILRGLVANLPRQGLLRETFQLVILAHSMEHLQTLTGPRVTEFDRLIQLAVQAVTETVVEAGQRDSASPENIVESLQTVIEPFLSVWMEHSKTLRVSVLESVAGEEEWGKLGDFIKKYGRDIFHARFMTLANLRGILHRGVGVYLDYLSENPDPLRPIKLVNDLEEGLPRAGPERWLGVILQSLIENYDHYRDYNTTTTQSDYGENLYQLLDFLRLKAGYERNAWQLRPLNLVHEVLARSHCPVAEFWRRQVQEMSKRTAQDHLRELARLEKMHGMRLATIAERLEERFVKPMELDGLCALIGPAMEQAPARAAGPGSRDADEKMSPLEEALQAFTATPSGAGLDVPQWIQRLEDEVQKVRNSKTALAHLAATLFDVPKVAVPFKDLAEQFRDWRHLAV